MDSWSIMVLLSAAALVFRWNGDSWPDTITMLSVLVVLFLIAGAVLGGLVVRFR